MDSKLTASVLIKRNNSFLFIRQDKPGGAYLKTLHLPGGGIEKGETPVEAALREVREEVGLELVELTPFDFDWDVIDYKGKLTLLIFLHFLANSPTGEARAGSDAQEIIWVPAQELTNKPLNPPSIRLLKKLDLM